MWLPVEQQIENNIGQLHGSVARTIDKKSTDYELCCMHELCSHKFSIAADHILLSHYR